VHAHRLELDGDPLFALEVHGVQQLRLHGALLHRAGELEHAVGQRGFAVVDVGDNAEII
jgi:hypothetical protein